MKNNPVLVIMAAGMGSRYGGLKQIDTLNEEGDLIIDFSIYDALKAGFKKVIFIIKKENEPLFREKIGNKIEKHIEVVYAYQEIDNIPAPFKVPADRVKPWGTGHAILSAKDMICGPFAVINADDYYGYEAFEAIYTYLDSHNDNQSYDYTMVGYQIEKTLTDFGHVSRGVCQLDDAHYLVDIQEKTHIQKGEQGPMYTEDDGKTFESLDKNSVVSMNMWGFNYSFLEELEKRFPKFLEEAMVVNPLKGEYFLPSVVDELIKEGKSCVKVLESHDQWYGVTYQEDKVVVTEAIEHMKVTGKYPRKLWK